MYQNVCTCCFFLTLSLPSPPSLLKRSLVKVLLEGTYAFNLITVTSIKWLRLINGFTWWHKETSKWPKGGVVLTGKDSIIIFLFSLWLMILWLSLIQGQCRVQFSATLRLRGRLGRNSCQSAMWDCFGTPKTVPQCALTTILTRSPAQTQSGELIH